MNCGRFNVLFEYHNLFVLIPYHSSPLLDGSTIALAAAVIPSCSNCGATQREDHAQPGVGAATPTSSSTACGRCCRGDSAAGPPCSDADLVPHEEPRAFDPKIPDLAGASRRLPAARQVSAGTWRCLASGYTPVCANRSQLEPSRTPRPLWLRAFGGTEVSPCNALPRVSFYPSAVILGTGAPRIVAPFPDMRLVKWHATCNTDARGRGACGRPRPT